MTRLCVGCQWSPPIHCGRCACCRRLKNVDLGHSPANQDRIWRPHTHRTNADGLPAPLLVVRVGDYCNVLRPANGVDCRADGAGVGGVWGLVGHTVFQCQLCGKWHRTKSQCKKRVADVPYLRQQALTVAHASVPTCKRCLKVKLWRRKWRELGLCARCAGA